MYQLLTSVGNAKTVSVSNTTQKLIGSNAQLFTLQRQEDETGVSGTGTVAEGVLFSDGTVALRWLTETACTGFYRHISDVVHIHGHGGKTQVVFK